MYASFKMQNFELIRSLENAGLNGILEKHFEEIFTFNPLIDEIDQLLKKTAHLENSHEIKLLGSQ